jgi:diketogulonate reductase-like aldo/keto reductase
VDPARGQCCRPDRRRSRPDQVRENAAAADIDLDAETIAEIETVFA